MSLNQRYKLIVNGVDVTSNVAGDIEFQDRPDMISTLSFSLKGTQFYAKSGGDVQPTPGVTVKDVIKMLDEVYFEGGVDNTLNYAPIFKGRVKYIRPQYPNSGSPYVTIEAWDTASNSAINRNFFLYPGKNPTRNWADVGTLKTSEIVRNVANDNKIPIGKFNGREAIKLYSDWEFVRKSPLTQKNESDWALLRKLAQRVNCSMWTSFNGDYAELNFVDKSYLREDVNNGNLSFIYLLRSGKGFEYSNLLPNEHPVWDVEVEQDFSEMSSVSRTVTVFDYKKGEEINVFSANIKENGKEITKYFTFEIDEERTAKLTQEQRADLEKIAYSIAGGENTHDIAEIAPYFKPAQFISDRNKLYVDKPYFGITITCTTEGNVNIVPRKNYRIRGLGRYGSESLEGTYYLRTLSHVWGDKGFLSKLELIK